MDEATASLDNLTEQELMQAINNAASGRTVIMIAHRLSTVRNCDQLYFLEEGRVEASGTYEELIKVHPEFRRMTVAV